MKNRHFSKNKINSKNKNIKNIATVIYNDDNITKKEKQVNEKIQKNNLSEFVEIKEINLNIKDNNVNNDSELKIKENKDYSNQTEVHYKINKNENLIDDTKSKKNTSSERISGNVDQNKIAKNSEKRVISFAEMMQQLFLSIKDGEDISDDN